MHSSLISPQDKLLGVVSDKLLCILFHFLLVSFGYRAAVFLLLLLLKCFDNRYLLFRFHILIVIFQMFLCTLLVKFSWYDLIIILCPLYIVILISNCLLLYFLISFFSIIVMIEFVANILIDDQEAISYTSSMLFF